MSAYAAAIGLRDILNQDTILASALAQHFAAPDGFHVIIGNRRISQIPANQLPAWVIDYEGGSAQPLDDEGGEYGLVIGNSQQSLRAQIGLSLVWTEQDPDQAAKQRGQLETLVVQLLLRNPKPGGISGAWLEGWESDAGTSHPHHLWASTVSAEYVISRS